MNKHIIQARRYKEHPKDENSVENSEIILELEVGCCGSDKLFSIFATIVPRPCEPPAPTAAPIADITMQTSALRDGICL